MILLFVGCIKKKQFVQLIADLFVDGSLVLPLGSVVVLTWSAD
jgi:hypothetical protein